MNQEKINTIPEQQKIGFKEWAQQQEMNLWYGSSSAPQTSSTGSYAGAVIEELNLQAAEEKYQAFEDAYKPVKLYPVYIAEKGNTAAAPDVITANMDLVVLYTAPGSAQKWCKYDNKGSIEMMDKVTAGQPELREVIFQKLKEIKEHETRNTN